MTLTQAPFRVTGSVFPPPPPQVFPPPPPNFPPPPPSMLTDPVINFPFPGEILTTSIFGVSGSASFDAQVVEVSLDGGPYLPAVGTFGWAIQYTGIANGNHTASVRARAGSATSNVVTRSFSVNTIGGLPPPPPPGGLETWINWIRASSAIGPDIQDGGSTQATTVVVDFQGTVAGLGTHIDMSIDNGSYIPVASPLTINNLTPGQHTVRLRAVDALGNMDTTPAIRTFTVFL